MFFGKIDMINDLVTFEFKMHKRKTKNAVEEYLQTCKELNREPQKHLIETKNLIYCYDG